MGFFEVSSGRLMEAGDVTAAPRAARGVPAWVLGLVPLLLIIAARRDVRGARRPGPRRAPRPAGRGARGRAHEARARRDRADRPQRRARRRSPSRRSSSTTRSSPSRAPSSRSGAWRPRSSRSTYPWIEGEAYEVAMLTSTGGTIAHEIPVAVRDARRGPRLLRPDGAARHLRRRDPDRARDALAAVDPPHPEGLAARRDGAHRRAARVPRDRCDARGRRARGRGLAGLRRRRARLPRRGRRVPRADRRRLVARAAAAGERRGGRERIDARAA